MKQAMSVQQARGESFLPRNKPGRLGRASRGSMIVLSVALLGAPWAHQALAGPTPEAPQQRQGGAATARAGGGSGGTAAQGGASGGRTTASRGGGGAARARAGAGGGGRTSAHRSPRRSGGHRVHIHHRGHHYHFPHSLGFGYYGYPYYLSSHHYRPYGYYGPVWHDYRFSEDFGGLDLNVKPKKAEVYVDGQRIGKVGAFDGYPSMLWLEKGVHDVVIYRPGHQTWHDQVNVLPGVVIDVDLRLEKGEATPPEEIVPPPTRRVPAAGSEAPRYEERSPERESRDGDGRRSIDLRNEPARLYLAVQPADASVYLDGRFLGTGDELASLRHGLMVNPGAHRVSVVRPSFESQEMDVDVAPGEDVDLVVRLERKDDS